MTKRFKIGYGPPYGANATTNSHLFQLRFLFCWFKGGSNDLCVRKSRLWNAEERPSFDFWAQTKISFDFIARVSNLNTWKKTMKTTWKYMHLLFRHLSVTTSYDKTFYLTFNKIWLNCISIHFIKKLQMASLVQKDEVRLQLK
jgi:hypothetical protein